MKKSTLYLLASALLAAALSVSPGLFAQSSSGPLSDPASRKLYDHACSLCEKGMYERARQEFEELSLKGEDSMVEGWRLLCAIGMQSEGVDILFDDYCLLYPYSPMIPRLRYEYALLLFDRRDYEGAGKLFSYIDVKDVSRRQRPEFLYKRAWCDFAVGNQNRAAERFEEVAGLKSPAYSGAACFTLGYINYDNGRFDEALRWFGKANDKRFADLSAYYTLDCRFQLKDYEYVVANGDELLPKFQDERAKHVARLLSESCLVLGKADRAKAIYDGLLAESPDTSRSGLFFTASLLYAVQDWQGARDKYMAMGDRSDSLGQIANYNLGYCNIRIRNKVEAMNCFRDASKQNFVPDITEDALFNYAKLAFDLNSDSSVFGEYMNRYPVEDKNDRIYSYIAVAALRNRDYAAAVEAFDKIDELDQTMKRNYMKSNYLRASQLIADKSWNDAVPYLKAAAYYARKNSPFRQLSRYWLGESYFRSGRFNDALEVFNELYNASALEGCKEGNLIPFNIAWCHFRKADYASARKWFDVYLSTGESGYRKGAMLRRADCDFLTRNYADAIRGYEEVSSRYPNVNDIYPYYQTGICYGLLGRNSDKVSALAPVQKADASSKYYSEANFELGRALVAAKRNDEARNCFLRLVDNPVDSVYFAKSAIELGMLCSNSGDLDAALAWYGSVVSKMPLSQSADDALAAMESIYQQRNDPQGYLDYLASIGRSSLKSEAEKERMFYNSAEQLYLSDDYERSLKALGEFMTAYPRSALMADAYFYMAECQRNLGRKEAACDSYSKVVELGSESYSEISMLQFAALSYSLQRYEDAYGAYARLREKGRMEANRYTALVGMMRSAWKARRYSDAIDAADALKEDIRSEKDLLREADWIRAKSFMQTSRRDEALAIFRELSRFPDTDEGAEASYLLIQDAYDRGEFDEAMNLCFDFSERSDGSRQYWLAKAFLVLGDCYAEKGEMVQAKATFESIKEGYGVKDDGVIEEVEQRLSYLNK